MTAPSATETGTILDVEQVTLGSELIGDTPQGSTSITVDDASDFDADSGGTCSIDGAQYAYAVTDVDDGVLTISPALAADASDGDRVDVWDTVTGVAASYYEALVQLSGSDDVDAVPARLASSLVPTFTHKLGIRDDGTGEACTMQLQGDEWVVVEVPADTVQVDGAAIADGTVPPSSLSFDLPESGTKVTVSATAPDSPAIGDLWINTSSGNVIEQWDGSQWDPFQLGPGAIADGAITAAKAAFTARMIGANTTTTSSTAPTGAITGDLWIDTSNGNLLKQYDGSEWVSLQDAAIAAAQSAASSAATAASNAQQTGNSAQSTANSAATAASNAQQTGASAQSAANSAAQAAQAAQQTGNSAQSAANAAQSTANSAQTAASAAASAASAAQTTANGRNSIFRQSSQPTANAAGDVWFDTGNGNRLAVWDGSTWQVSPLQGVAVANLDAGAITTGTLAAGRIGAGTITAAMIASDTITAAQLAAGSVTASELAAAAVTAAAIAANTITAAQIAANTITAGQIAANTITAGQIAAATITGDRLVANTITAGQIAGNTITAGQIAANTITAAQIAANTITAAQIAANTITAGQIAANTITAAQIAADTITAGQIAAGAITASELAAGAVTATAIAAGTITGDRLAVGTITGNLIAAGAIVAGQIAAGALDAFSINAASLSAVSLSGHVIGSTVSGSDVLIDGDGGRVLVYEQVPTVVVNSHAGTSGSYTVPSSGVTALRLEGWGSGGNGAANGGGGGGGGEYAAEPTWPVNPGDVVTYSAPPAPGSSAASGASATISVNGTVIVTANGGTSATGVPGAPGGTGSTNTLHFNGGQGGASAGGYGGGGGSSAGTMREGNAGAAGVSGGAAGGSAPIGAGAGAAGAGSSGSPGNGSVPGGGGGGGNSSGGPSSRGTTGAAGAVRVTYFTTTVVGSIAGVSGTTDAFGNTVPTGMRNSRPELTGSIGGYISARSFSASIPNSSATDLGTGAYTVQQEVGDYATSPWSAAGVFTVPVDGFYTVAFNSTNLMTAGKVSYMAIRVNASTNTYQASTTTAGTTAGAIGVTAPNAWFPKGTQLQFRVFQATGAAQTVTGTVTIKKEA